MRPTIPLGPWRLAIDLTASRAVNALQELPARGCSCDTCRLWEDARVTHLPESLQHELRRIGVEPARPSDVYILSDEDAYLGIRVSYHCVGRIVSGPPEFRQSPDSGTGRHYELLPETSNRASLAVAYQGSLSAMPPWADATMQPLIALDLYVQIPQGSGGRWVANSRSSSHAAV